MTDDSIKQTDREDALFAQVNFKHYQIVKLLDSVLSMLSNLLSTATEHFLLKTNSPVEASQNKVSLKLSARQVALIAFPLFWLVIYFFLTPNPMLMLAGRWPLILTGFFGALMGNLSAIGGGFVFIPVTIFVFHIAPLIALKIALASQAFGMTTGAIGWLSKTPICKRTFLYALPGLFAGATTSSLLLHPSPQTVKGLFGVVSIILGILVVVSVLTKRQAQKDTIDKNLGPIVSVVAFIGGLISGWVAIGEGEVVAAFLILVGGVKSRTSIATGVLLLAISSIYLTLLHQFFLGGIPWDYACFTILGCVFGASLAPIIGRMAAEHRLKVIFASIAILDGCLFIYQWLRA